MQFRSLIPENATVAAKSLVTSQEDKGRLGNLTRVLSVSHIASLPKLSRIKYNMTRPDPAWRSSRMRGLTMRRAAWITTYGMQSRFPQQPILLRQDHQTSKKYFITVCGYNNYHYPRPPLSSTSLFHSGDWKSIDYHRLSLMTSQTRNQWSPGTHSTNVGRMRHMLHIVPSTYSRLCSAAPGHTLVLDI